MAQYFNKSKSKIFNFTTNQKILILFLLVGSLFTANPIHTLLSLIFLAIIFRLFWTKEIPAILFWGLIFQWLSITLKVFYGNLNGISFTDRELHKFPFSINEAFYLSLYGLTFYITGLYLVTYKTKKFNFNLASLLKYDTKKLLFAYFWFQVIFNFLIGYFGLFSGLSQLLVQITHLKWGLLFIIFYNVYKKKEFRFVLFLILLFEIIFSFSTYWSSYKEYLIFIFIFLPVLELKLRFKHYFALGLLVVLIFFISLVWQATKGDYRSYLSKGEKSQAVLVSPTESIPYFIALAIKTPIEFDFVLWTLVDRVSYIDFFSATIDHIPNTLPYQGGQVIFDSFYHLVTPRIIFKGKEAIDDSKMLNELSGLNVSDASKGTSMSLGYMGEAYADFGPYFMVLSTFLIGLLTGLVYRYVLKKSTNTAWFLIFLIPFFYLVNVNGMNTIKILGNLGWYFIMVILFTKYFIPALDKKLR